jgi:hypothetical protein
MRQPLERIDERSGTVRSEPVVLPYSFSRPFPQPSQRLAAVLALARRLFAPAEQVEDADSGW